MIKAAEHRMQECAAAGWITFDCESIGFLSATEDSTLV